MLGYRAEQTNLRGCKKPFVQVLEEPEPSTVFEAERPETKVRNWIGDPTRVLKLVVSEILAPVSFFYVATLWHSGNSKSRLQFLFWLLYAVIFCPDQD